MQIFTLTDIRMKLCHFAREQTRKETGERHEGKKLNKGQRVRVEKMEERSNQEYNSITSRESGGYVGGREQPCVSRLDVTGNSRESLWVSFIPQTMKERERGY